MLDVLYAAIAAPNLPITALLGLILLYWLSVILGALDVDSFDVDLDLDVDVDVDIDVDVDVDVGVDADVDVDADVQADTDVQAGAGGGLFIGLLRFFNFGDLPFMIVLSLLILSMWTISLICNHAESVVNPSMSLAWAAALFIPNTVLSLFITKLVTQPLVPIFKKLNTAAKKIDFRGKMGIITMATNEDKLGQIKLTVDNSVVLLKVKGDEKDQLKKGQKVLIIDKVEDEKCFIVRRYDSH